MFTVRNTTPCAVAVLTVVLSLFVMARNVDAIPAFGRRYGLSCDACHTVYPKLNSFGKDFAYRGLSLPGRAEEAEEAKAPATEQEKIFRILSKYLPISLHGKVLGSYESASENKTDFQFEELQINAGGQISENLSFYVHHHLVEEGEPGDPLETWLRVNDIVGDNAVNVRAGLFLLPISIGMLPEITQVTHQPHLIYSKSLGGNSFAFGTPQLGALIEGRPGDGVFRYAAGVVNGSGFSFKEASESFDDNSFKDVFGVVSYTVKDLTLEGFGYFGRASVEAEVHEEDEGEEGEEIQEEEVMKDDDFYRVGGDFDLELGNLNFYGLFMYGRDSDPFPNSTGSGNFWGGFIEADYLFTPRVLCGVRYGIIRDRDSLEASEAEEEEDGEMEEPGDGEAATRSAMESLGGAEEQRLYTHAVTLTTQYLLFESVRLMGEYQFLRQKEDNHTAQVGFHFAF